MSLDKASFLMRRKFLSDISEAAGLELTDRTLDLAVRIPHIRDFFKAYEDKIQDLNMRVIALGGDIKYAYPSMSINELFLDYDCRVIRNSSDTALNVALIHQSGPNIARGYVVEYNHENEAEKWKVSEIKYAYKEDVSKPEWTQRAALQGIIDEQLVGEVELTTVPVDALTQTAINVISAVYVNLPDQVRNVHDGQKQVISRSRLLDNMFMDFPPEASIKA